MRWPPSPAPPRTWSPRLRALVRRELLEIEADPRSPERGQYRFVQSLIQEVAYGTLARRDRRSRHLAVARHYEGIGDDELAGALASHYLAAREASDEGAEADAVAGQARLALTGAADRAAALGAYDQAVSYLEQALAITSDAADRAPLLDRATRSATAAARPDAQRLRRGGGAELSGAGRPGRCGRSIRPLRQDTHGRRRGSAGRPRCSRPRSPQAEEVGRRADPGRGACTPGASPHAVGAIRCGCRAGGSLPGNRRTAQPGADRGRGVPQQVGGPGHRRPAPREHRAGPRGPRARPGARPPVVRDARAKQPRLLAHRRRSGRGLADTFRGTRARETDRRSRPCTTGWPAPSQPPFTKRAETGTPTRSSCRRRSSPPPCAATGLGCSPCGRSTRPARGEDLEERPKRIREVIGDTTDPDELFQIVMSESASTLLTGQVEAAYPKALHAADLMPQNPEIGLEVAMRSATWSGNLERAREVAARVAVLAATGPLTEALRLQADGGRGGARGSTRRRDGRLPWPPSGASASSGRCSTAAVVSVDASVLLPDDPGSAHSATEGARCSRSSAPGPTSRSSTRRLTPFPPRSRRSESRAETPTA